MTQHDKRELVNRLTKLARDFAHTEQLRERIAGDVLPALEAARAAERERLQRDVAGLHMAQSVNNQNYPAAWHDGVDAALEVIRGA